MDRIIQMKRNQKSAQSVFKEIGKVCLTHFETFEVTTEVGGIFILSPNAFESVPTIVHIDEFYVPFSLRRRGVGTHAMTSLCRLADKYQFRLEGGPIGWSDFLWREKLVEWMLRFGFISDRRFEPRSLDDPAAFYVCRQPAPNVKT